MPTTEPSAPRTSVVRAWFALVSFASRRQLRLGLPFWISLNVLALALLWVALVTVRYQWDLVNRPATFKRPMYTYGQLSDLLNATTFRPWNPPLSAGVSALTGPIAAALASSALANFSDKVIFSLYLGFLMPLWTLSFATAALGGEREDRTLLWLTTRPVPRWGVYLAVYLGMLPWCLGMNLIGLLLLCVLGGEPGWHALTMYWPGAITGTLAFAALFHLAAATLRRPAVVGLAYVFFLEPVMSNMPGFVKRFSVTFYVRCQMFEAAEQAGFQPVNREVYSAVDGTTAVAVLVGATLCLLVGGAIWFSRSEDAGDP
jgi:hypothetical protein